MAALESGAVGGAGIDCFEHILLHGDDGPPTPEQHLGLPSMENVALTPHVAACERSNTPSVFFRSLTLGADSSGAMRQVGEDGILNLVAALSSRLPTTENIVNPDVIERWEARFGGQPSLLTPTANL